MTVLAMVIDRPRAAGIALVALLVPVGLLWLIGTKPTAADSPAQKRRRGIGGLLIGKDGRASTSKLQAVLWTFAVFFAVAFMLVWGRSTQCGDATHREKPNCQAATRARASFDAFVSHGLQPEYYVLLGFPIAAAVAAKAITAARVDDNPQAKTELSKAEGEGGPAQSLREVVSNDQGETDLLDFQYFAFNLLALAFFFAQFLTRPAAGLPDLPPTLIALSGLSAATYVAKKALAESEA